MRSTAVLVMALLAACGGASQSVSEPSPAASAETGLVARPLGNAGGDASPTGYFEYLPPSYSQSGEASPLLIFLHGSGEAGDGTEATLDLVTKLGIPQLIADGDWPAEHPFVVLSPQYGTEPANHECDIAEEVARFIDFALLTYNVDQSRVYLTGISCGAIGIWDYLATDGGDAVAATVTISGHAKWAFEEAGCQLAEMPPMWAFHGAEDEVVPVDYVQGQVEQIHACEGADADGLELTVYPDADHVGAIGRTYDVSTGHDIYAWMLEHTND